MSSEETRVSSNGFVSPVLPPRCHRPGRIIVTSVHDPGADIAPAYGTYRYPTTKPPYPYPREDGFEQKERAHFDWYAVHVPRSSSIPPSLTSQCMTPDTSVELANAIDHPPRTQQSYAEKPGRLAWLHVVAGFLVIFNAQGFGMSFGIFQTYYSRVLLNGTPPSKIAWIGSVQIFLVFFAGLFVSPAVGKGYFRFCFSGGSLLLFLSTLVTSYCRHWWQFFFVQGFITGVAMGSMFTSGLIVLLSYFSTHLGIATGIAASGAPIAGIVIPLLGRALLDKVGFGWTMRIFAIINLLTLLVANAIVRPRLMTTVGKSSTLYDPPMLRDPPFLLMTVGMFFTYWGFFVTYVYMVLYGVEVVGLSNNAAISLLVAMNAANFIGRFLPNLMSDACLGPLSTIAPWTFLSSTFAFLWIRAVNGTGVFLISCGYGFASAAIQSLYTSTIHSFALFEGEIAVKRIGFVLATIGFAVLTGTPIGGALITKGWIHVQIFAGTTLAIGGLFFVAARVARSGWKAEKL